MPASGLVTCSLHRPPFPLCLCDARASLCSTGAGGFATVKPAADSARDDLVAAGAARPSLCAARRTISWRKGFAIIIKPLGMHPFASLAVAFRAGLLVVWMQMLRGRAGTPIAAKGIEVAPALFLRIFAHSGCFFARSYHLSQTHKMLGFDGWFLRPHVFLNLFQTMGTPNGSCWRRRS